MLWYELTRWWTYRRIKHPKMHQYVWTVPLMITGIITAGMVMLPVSPSISGKDGVLDTVVQVAAILPGFFLAALAAVSTFQRPEMDVDMPSPAPEVKLRIGADTIETTVTRRMFLSYLFSYLTIVSLALVAFCTLANFIAPSVIWWISSIGSNWAGVISCILQVAVFSFVTYWCASILTTTLHGIFFLTERMHQPN